MIRVATACVLMLAGTALAQYEITIDVENPTLLPGESTVVTMYAGFDPALFAMAGVATDFLTSVGSEGWGAPALVGNMAGPGTATGAPSPTGYDGIVAGQIHDGLSLVPADPSNPIAFWQATYTAPMDATAPFDVRLSTLTSRYDVYIGAMEYWQFEPHVADLVEGSATIRVVPAPASALVLACGLIAIRRRR